MFSKQTIRKRERTNDGTVKGLTIGELLGLELGSSTECSLGIVEGRLSDCKLGREVGLLEGWALVIAIGSKSVGWLVRHAVGMDEG